MSFRTLDEIEDRSRRALVAHGAADGVADQVADAIRVAESNGNKICGLYYLESYCRQLTTGRVDGTVEPQVSVDRPGAVRVDARFGFAQPAFAAGFAAAVRSARDNGICGYSLEHTHTCTALGYFTEQFAREGLLALGVTNATPRVAPPGGATPVLGTNPIAMAVPDGKGAVAFQFDFSTSAVALGKITMAAAAGESIRWVGPSTLPGSQRQTPLRRSKGRSYLRAATRGMASGLSSSYSPRR